MIKANARLLAKLVSDVNAELHRLFPAYRWSADATVDGSMLNIRAPETGSYAYQLPTRQVQQVTGRREALMRAGGEVLERYHVSREKRETSERPKNRRGDLIPEL